MNYTFSGFSKAGNAVVRGAIAAAQDMGHTYVGTEHLLLALARDDTGEAAAFLLERQVYSYQVGRLLRGDVPLGDGQRGGGCCASRWAAAGARAFPQGISRPRFPNAWTAR